MARRDVQFGSPDRGKVPAASLRGRRCESFECDTVLSIYNRSARCSVHEAPALRTALTSRRP